MADPDPGATRRKEMLETNQAQRAYYDQTDGGTVSTANGWGTNLWRQMRQRALRSVSEAQRARVYDVHRRWLGDLSQKKVLDLGSGHGSPLSHYLATNAGAYHALDLAPSQIAQLRDRIGAADNRIFTVGDFLSDDYAEADFDVIYAHSVFHHFRHLGVMLARVATKLAPDGQVISYDPLETWLPIRLLRRVYRPFQTDRDWEYPFDARAIGQIGAQFAVIDRLGVFGRGKWALVLGILSPSLAARWGDRLFASDFDRPQTDRDIRASLHVSFLLQAPGAAPRSAA